MGQVEVFSFSQEKLPIRAQIINGEPWFVAKDVCDILKYANHRDAIKKHCKEKGVAFCDTLTDGGVQSLKYINEGNLYRLIINCTLPMADAFESWIFDEVLPSIRKKGYYGVRKGEGDYIDARDIPYMRGALNGAEVRMVEIDGEKWYSINDVNAGMGARTDSSQNVKRLNAKRTMAKKIWLYGVTQPGWFTTELGVRLLMCASQKNRKNVRLMLPFANSGGTQPSEQAPSRSFARNLDFDGKEG